MLDFPARRGNGQRHLPKRRREETPQRRAKRAHLCATSLEKSTSDPGMYMKTKDNDNMSRDQPLCSTSPRDAAMATGTRQRHAATRGRRGGQNASTSALLHSKNRRGRMSMKTKDKYNLSVLQKVLKNQTPVILSGAKDLRSFHWFDDLRTTAEILRGAQDDSCAFRDHRGEQT